MSVDGASLLGVFLDSTSVRSSFRLKPCSSPSMKEVGRSSVSNRSLDTIRGTVN